MSEPRFRPANGAIDGTDPFAVPSTPDGLEEISPEDLDAVIGGLDWPGGQPAPIPVPPPFTGPRGL
jgi:hypothetical protein